MPLTKPPPTQYKSPSIQTNSQQITTPESQPKIPPQYQSRGQTDEEKSSASGEFTGNSTNQSQLPGRADGPRGMAIEGVDGAPSLEGVVDLSNTMDTDVTTTYSPAVVHERVTPTVHHITEEKISREIHTHDVFHRIQPVIETEIVPAKHYIPDPEKPGSLMEIPASHSLLGRKKNWQISEVPQTSASSNVQSTPPYVGETGVQQKREPVLVSVQQQEVAEGKPPKTEYLWKHPPIFETESFTTGETATTSRMNRASHEEYASEKKPIEDTRRNNNHQQREADIGAQRKPQSEVTQVGGSSNTNYLGLHPRTFDSIGFAASEIKTPSTIECLEEFTSEKHDNNPSSVHSSQRPSQANPLPSSSTDERKFPLLNHDDATATATPTPNSSPTNLRDIDRDLGVGEATKMLRRKQKEKGAKQVGEGEIQGTAARLDGLDIRAR